jgi:superfamily II DNA/RNA helicase
MTEQPTPGSTGADGAADQSTGATSDAGTTGGSQTFKHEDVEHIVQQRLAAERKKYADYKDLKAKAEEFDRLQEAQKSELEREREKAQKLEAELERERQARRDQTVKSTIEKAASQAGFVDPEDAVLSLDRSAFVGEDGDVSERHLAAALEDLAKRKPHLVGAARTPSFDAGVRDSGSGNIDELFGRLVKDKL